MTISAAQTIQERSESDLFDYLSSINSIKAQQFGLFRHILFGRVFLTVPSITEALRHALLSQNQQSIKTCFKNLEEELSEPNHQLLMARAFNYIARKVYNLPEVSLIECYQAPILAEEIIYRYTITELYRNHPLIASRSQELCSGGTPNKIGMMGKMYQVFLSIYSRNSISKSEFRTEVLPYFEAHIKIDQNFDLVFDESSVEYQHGIRALIDYQKQKIANDSPFILAFITAQNNLFQATLKQIQNTTDFAR